MSYNTALIVDDSKLARIALKKKLEKRGLQIVMAEDAKEALGVLENTAIDIVFMDHLMPDMDGFQATREIKANQATAHVPVIMCSGKEKQGYLEEARAIGASNVLPKPAASEAIDAVFEELEEALAAAAVVEQESPVQQAEPETAVTQAAFGEDEVQALLQPMVDQLRAIAMQLDSHARDVEQRFTAANDSLQMLEQRPTTEAVDVEKLKGELEQQIEQRLAALAIPEAEALQASVMAALQSELSGQWQQQLTLAINEAVVGLEQKTADDAQSQQPAFDLDEALGEWQQRVSRNVEAATMQMVEDKGEQLEDAWQQQMQALRVELLEECQKAAAQPEMPDLDSLKASIVAELSVQRETQQDVVDAAIAVAEADNESANDDEAQPGDSYDEPDIDTWQASPLALVQSHESARRKEIKVLAWISLFSGVAAAASIALHLF